MELPGDSFEERWTALKDRIAGHCAEVEAPYPEETLRRAQPWFEHIGEWYDWTGPLFLRHLIVMPEGVDPALQVMREVDSQLSRFHEDGESNRHGLPGEHHFLVYTTQWVNLRLLQVVRGGSTRSADGATCHPHFRDSATLALAGYVKESGNVVYHKRWPPVAEAIHARAEDEDRSFDDVLVDGLKTAVVLAIRELFESVKIDTPPGVSPHAVRFTRNWEADRTFLSNLTPGTTPDELRSHIGNLLCEDFLGPHPRRNRPAAREELEAKVRASVGTRLHRILERERSRMSELYAQELLSHPTLSDKQRAAIRLHFEEGLTPTEIGERLGCSRSTVSTHLQRAREKLRRVDG